MLRRELFTKPLKSTMIFLMLHCIIPTINAQSSYQGQVDFTNITPAFIKDTIAPMFPEGENELFRLMRKEFRFPQIALEKGLDGFVVIQFQVNKDSTLSDFKILKDNHLTS